MSWFMRIRCPLANETWMGITFSRHRQARECLTYQLIVRHSSPQASRRGDPTYGLEKSRVTKSQLPGLGIRGSHTLRV